MKLSEMREILAKRDIRLTKSLGQNFLHDANQLQKIAGAGELSEADKVLEIGPGLGPLTELLLGNAGEVLAIEMDGRLVEILRERFVLAKNLKLVHDDALEFLRAGQVFSLSKTENEKPETGRMPIPHDWSDWKLVANLPYSVASPILVELAAGIRAPKMMVVTLQLEVARRLMAQADDDDYGILTLLVQLDFAPQSFFKIPAECFFPSPDVDSACVVLERRAQPLLPENLRPAFVKIVKRAFSQRRKMMLKLLKQDWAVDTLAVAFGELSISPQERAEKLSLEQFVGLTVALTGKIYCAPPSAAGNKPD